MQVLQNEETEKPLKKVDPQLLKMALSPYPKLRAALFPSCTAHGILPPDISLYHLLQVHPGLLAGQEGRGVCLQLKSGVGPGLVPGEPSVWS